MQLALGTVQFGLNYGIAGRGQIVPEKEVRTILKAAFADGVRVLDTAPAYGQVESQLLHLCDGLPFQVISKIGKIPTPLTAQESAEWALKSAQLSRQRLGSLLKGLLFHSAQDLADEKGELIWNTVSSWAQDVGVKVGVSGYSLEDITLSQHLDPSLVQLPGNAFDQRLKEMPPREDVDVCLRSVFLQGLLLSSLDHVERKLPQALPQMERWHHWLQQTSLSPISACLSIAKGFSAVSHVVVGVDGLAHWQEVCQAWQLAQAYDAPELRTTNPNLIDPRFWEVEKSC